ncbi:MAG TPA: ferredoxin reductase [Candidatus Cybelea sp.]|nr:ferredoxin reductase [Candidatus Cybelea sp.]
MAGTAIHGRLNWYVAKLVERRKETPTASTLRFDVPGWPGHDAGQHVDVRLRAEDGYTAVRTYSIASAPMGERVELTVEQMPEGEVSPYLVEAIAPGNPLEILGPIGGWFVWKPDQREPVQLIAGGSGIVPLMAMIRSRRQTGSSAPFRLLYSVRSPEAIYYADELRALAADNSGLEVTFAYTRAAPANSMRTPQRIDAALVAASAFAVSENPITYVCGPTGFVEAAAGFLTQAGYAAPRVKTERFGPTGVA